MNLSSFFSNIENTAVSLYCIAMFGGMIVLFLGGLIAKAFQKYDKIHRVGCVIATVGSISCIVALIGLVLFGLAYALFTGSHYSWVDVLKHGDAGL